MGKKDPRVDAYIEKAKPFAQPILRHIRQVVHAACPKTEETLKWSMPTFMYEGEMLCGMAAFKEHAVLGFWKASLILDQEGRKLEDDAMGQFGCIRTVKDLPPKRELTGYIRKAMELNEQGIKVKRAKPAAPKAAAKVPADLAAALERNRKAAATFDGFPPSCRREYVEWITEAKREATRLKRLKTTIEWLAEGKRRNWKYENC
jgi:uncharacterized protein YdeI (YjbR/CyaY-like superfamily)